MSYIETHNKIEQAFEQGPNVETAYFRDMVKPDLAMIDPEAVVLGEKIETTSTFNLPIGDQKLDITANSKVIKVASHEVKSVTEALSLDWHESGALFLLTATIDIDDAKGSQLHTLSAYDLDLLSRIDPLHKYYDECRVTPRPPRPLGLIHRIHANIETGLVAEYCVNIGIGKSALGLLNNSIPQTNTYSQLPKNFDEQVDWLLGADA